MQTTILKKSRHLATGVLMTLSMLSASAGLSANNSNLIDLLASQTGVTTEQATGGAKALYDFAKSALNSEQIDQISKALPEIAQLSQTSTQEQSSSISDSMVNLAASLSGSSNDKINLEKLGELKNSFDQLGIKSEQIQQFIPIIVDYVKSQGNETASALLNKALSL